MRKSLRSILKAAIVTCALVLTLSALVVGIVVARLTVGPVEMPVPQSLLDRVVAEAAPGWRVEAGGAKLDFSADGPLNGLQLHDVALFDDSGTSVVSAPLLGLKFKLAPSLDPAEILTVREVAVSGAAVAVTRDTDGTFQFDIASGDGAEEGDPFTALMESAPLDLLPLLRIEDATVTYTDLARDTVWRTEEARLTLDPSSEGLRGTLALALEGGTGEALLDAYRDAASGETDAVLTLTGITPARIAGMHPVLDILKHIDAPLTGRIEARAAADGTIRTISTDIEASGGTVSLDGETPTPLQTFSAKLSCDAEERHCDLADLALATPDYFGAASGMVQQTGDETYRAALSLIAPTLRLSPDAGPIGAGRARITGDYDAGSGIAWIEEASLVSVKFSDGDGTDVRVDRAHFSAEIDTNAASATIPDWRVAAVSVKAKGGISATVGEGAGKAAYADGRVDLTDLIATALGIRADGKAQRVARLTGDLRYDTANAEVGLHLTASDSAFDTPQGPIEIGQFALRAQADMNTNRLGIDSLQANSITLTQAGQSQRIATLELTGVANLEALMLDQAVLSLGDAVLTLPDLYDAPFTLAQARAEFRAEAADGGVTLSIRNLTATVDDLPAQAKGIVHLRADESLAARLEATLGPVDLRRVPGHWPKPVAPGGLIWVRDNLKSGNVGTIAIAAQVDTAQPAKDALRLSFDFSDTALTFAPGMPPITAARGRGIATLDRFDVALDHGQVDVPGSGRLVLDGSSFAITDFAPDIPDGHVSVKVAGGIQPVLRLLDTEPLGVISPTGFKIDRTKGRADLRIVMTLPLAADLKIEDVRFDGRAEVHEYALIEPKTGMEISGDLMRVKATPEGMVIRSDARIDGLAARIAYRQEFERQSEGRPDAVLSVESFLSLNDFARHGFDLSRHVSGLTALDATIALYDDGDTKFTAEADMTNLALKVDRLGWTKARGVPATLTLSGIRSTKGAGRIDALVLRGEGMAAEGTFGFDASGSVNRAQFSRILLDEALDVGLRYDSKSAGGATLRIEGPRLDLRTSFARAIDGAGSTVAPVDSTAGAPTEIALNVAQVRLRDDLTVVDLRGDVRLHGDAFNAADLEGRLNGIAPATLRAERRPSGLALRLISEDAGAFVRATDVFAGAYGGRLMLDALTVDTLEPSQIRGVIRIDDVVMRDGATMRRILSGGGVASLLRQLASGGISFQKIQLPFSGIGPLWQIEQGVAFGPSLGLTLDGSYDLKARNLDLNGSVSPAYAINGALGNVPVLGKILTGGEGEGVFGVNFSVEGDADHPSVRVNPLSALAPGFLRKIVAGVGKGTPQPRPDGTPRFKSGNEN